MAKKKQSARKKRDAPEPVIPGMDAPIPEPGNPGVDPAAQEPAIPGVNPAALEHDDPEDSAPFVIVGIGASAGGLEAISRLLHEVPENTGMAFVVVQHLDPSHASMLT